MTNEQTNLFEHRLQKVEGKVESLEEKMDRIALDLVEVHTNYKHISKSLDNLTKVGWSMVVLGFTTLLGFFIWYVQSR